MFPKRSPQKQDPEWPIDKKCSIFDAGLDWLLWLCCSGTRRVSKAKLSASKASCRHPCEAHRHKSCTSSSCDIDTLGQQKATAKRLTRKPGTMLASDATCQIRTCVKQALPLMPFARQLAPDTNSNSETGRYRIKRGAARHRPRPEPGSCPMAAGAELQKPFLSRARYAAQSKKVSIQHSGRIHCRFINIRGPVDDPAMRQKLLLGEARPVKKWLASRPHFRPTMSISPIAT